MKRFEFRIKILLGNHLKFGEPTPLYKVKESFFTYRIVKTNTE